MVYKFFDKKSMGSGTAKPSSLERVKKLKDMAKPTTKSSALVRSSLERSSSILADELHKSVIKKFNKRKEYSQFKDNIWGVDLAAM